MSIYLSVTLVFSPDERASPAPSRSFLACHQYAGLLAIYFINADAVAGWASSYADDVTSRLYVEAR